MEEAPKQRPPAERADDANEFLHEKNHDELIAAFEDKNRDDWQKPEEILAKLGDLSNKVVADIGAGSGYFSFRIAQKAKQTIAIDIDKRFLAHIDHKNRNKLNLETRLGAEDSPNLKEAEADIVIIVNTYHHINARTDYMRQVNKGLKPGGKLVIVDFKKGDLPLGPPDRLKINKAQIIQEIEAAGYSVKEEKGLDLPYQLMFVATKL